MMPSDLNDIAKFFDGLDWNALHSVDEETRKTLIDMLCERDDEIRYTKYEIMQRMSEMRVGLKELKAKSDHIRAILAKLMSEKNPYKTKHFTIHSCQNRGTETLKVLRHGNRKKVFCKKKRKGETDEA